MLSSAIVRRESLCRETGLTVEAAAYAAVCLLGLGLRLAALGSAPLSPNEAAQALAAHRLALGSPAEVGETGPTAPALLTLQALVFFLFGAGDSTARLPVAVLTAFSPLAFWLLRPVLGRNRSLLAALLLSLSPFWTASGSMGLGRGLAGAALLFALGFGAKRALGGGRNWAVATGVGLAVALGSSADAWAALVLGLIVWLAVRRDLPRPRHTTWAGFGLGLGAGALVISTAGFLHPAGFQSMLDLGGSLAHGLLQREPGVFARQVLVLLAYEPLLLVPALGVILLIPPQDPVGRALYLWTGTSLLLILVAGAPGLGLVLALPALAVLAAPAVEGIGRRLASLDGRLLPEAAAVATVLGGYAAVALTGLAKREDTVFLLLLITAAGIGLALLGLLWLRQGPQTAGAVGASALLVVLFLWSLANSTQGATLRHRLPQEVTLPTVSAAGLGDLVRDVTDLSWSRTGHGDELALVAERSVGPAVAWYLRHMRDLTWVEVVAGEADAPALLTEGTDLLLTGGNYVGQEYAVAGNWRPRFADVGAFLSWLLYREVPTVDVEWERVSLWVRSDGG
ncbi:MAG: hypothetical protein HPY83_12215 [Anaerolineae bacterium]|nr:hypothetical protein [Anaerolineae bacterium]